MKKVIVLALSLGLMGALTGCATSGRMILGIVADVDGNPVVGAIVTTEPPTASVATDKSGRYMIEAVPKDTYSLKAAKLGYVSYPTQISVRDSAIVQGDIQLTPEDMVPAPATAVYVDPAPAAVVPAPAAVASEGDDSAKSDDKDKAWWEKK